MGLYSGTPIYGFAIDPVSSATIYVATSGGGVFKSTNGGKTGWSHVGTYGSVYSIAIDPVDPQTIYVGGVLLNNLQTEYLRGIFKTTNGGKSWTQIFNSAPSYAAVNCLVIDPLQPQTIYAGTYGDGILRTTDGGKNWAKVNSGLTYSNISSLAIDPKVPRIIYAGAYYTGVSKSTNAGKSWIAINAGLTYYTIHSLAINPINPQIIYAGGYGGVFTSVNGGWILPVTKGTKIKIMN